MGKKTIESIICAKVGEECCADMKQPSPKYVMPAGMDNDFTEEVEKAKLPRSVTA